MDTTQASLTVTARLASRDVPAPAPIKRSVASWFGWQVGGWAMFLGFLVVFSAIMLGAVRAFAQLDSGKSRAFEGVGNILILLLVFVMVLATLLTMADRKWSALMQDRVGPNRARLPIPGLSDSPLAGLPHIIADVVKMLFKEDFLSTGAAKQKFIFNIAPFLAFGPAFCLFAIIPMSPEVEIFGHTISLQVLHLDWGLLYVLALASLGVFGVALAGWASDNKFALLGGLRASAQMVSYEVTLGLTLVGAFIAFGTVQLDVMTNLQGATLEQMKQGGTDPTLFFGWLPAWGIFMQPIASLLFLVAAMAEIKRTPFDTPEGESEIIGYYLEYSGLKSGMYLIAEYVETVVIAAIFTAVFLGGWHLPWIEPALYSFFEKFAHGNAAALLAVFQVFGFIIKTLIMIWVMFLARWALPRFRYDQVMHLGWKMILPVSIANVVLTAAAFLYGFDNTVRDGSIFAREMMARVGIVEIFVFVGYVMFWGKTPAAETPDAHGHGAHADPHSAPAAH